MARKLFSRIATLAFSAILALSTTPLAFAQEEPADANTEANTPAAENTPAFIGTYEGEWVTFGHPELGRSFSRFVIQEVIDGTIVKIEYTYKDTKPVDIKNATLVEPNKIRFGTFDLNRDSAEFTLIFSDDGKSLLATRHAMWKGEEFFNEAQMNRVSDAG